MHAATLIGIIFISITIFHLDSFQNKVHATEDYFEDLDQENISVLIDEEQEKEEEEEEDLCYVNQPMILACQNNSNVYLSGSTDEDPNVNYSFKLIDCGLNYSFYQVYLDKCKTPYQFLKPNATDLKECPSTVQITDLEFDLCEKGTETEYFRGDSCPFLSNFSVKAYLDERIDNALIRLNISWTNAKRFSEVKDERIVITSSQTHCYRTETPIDVLNKSYLIEPALNLLNPEFGVTFDCEYNITLEAYNQSCFLEYTVPECIEDMCNCEKYTSLVSITEMEPQEDGVFIVRWENPEVSISKEINKPYTITNISFVYTNEGSDPLLSRKHVDVLSIDLKNNWSKLKFTKLETDQPLTLYAQFTNNFSCSHLTNFNFQAPNRGNKTLIVVIIVLFVAMIALKRSCIKKYLGKVAEMIKKKFHPEPPATLTPLNHTPNITMANNIQYTPLEILSGNCDKYEIAANRVIIKEEIGSGAFGKVYSAKALGLFDGESFRMVAVKTLNKNATKEEMDDLMAEIAIFKKIGDHPNIVQLLGCCTLEVPYMMLMEFVPCGDLKNYLLELRAKWKQKQNNVFFPDTSDGVYILPTNPPRTPQSPASITSSRLPSTSDTISTTVDDSFTPLLAHYSDRLEKVLDPQELQSFALQIARGMAHLESIAITHRDLAARNILINEYKVLKISDFGMSRTGPYVNHKTKKLPLRWMAIEAIINQVYDSKSDVWSFGVVLWEIGTLGAFPYDKVMDSFLIQYLQLGKRLDRPEVCTDELFKIMEQCWAADPLHRPSFHELVEMLDVKKRRVYVDFSQLNPTYIFPPSELVNSYSCENNVALTTKN